MNITLNGQEEKIEVKTLGELISYYEIDPKKVIVEVNRKIFDRNTNLDYSIRPGDRIELVRFIGGG